MGRLTIAGMLGLVAMIGVSLAAIREASQVWAAIVPAVRGPSILAFSGGGNGHPPASEPSPPGSGRLSPRGPYFVGSVLLAPRIGPLPVITPWIDTLFNADSMPPPPPIRDVWLPPDEHGGSYPSRSGRQGLDHPD